MNPIEGLIAALGPTSRVASVPGEAAPDGTHLVPPPLAQDSISDLGRALSRTTQTKSRDQDIDDSDLPDAVKRLLQMIRDLRQMLDRLFKELQQIQADQTLPDEAKRIRLLQLQAQISAVNGALIQTTRELASTLRDLKLDTAQQMTAGQLALG